MLVTSNFSFSHSVFKRLVLQTCANQGLFGKGLIFNCLPNNNFWDSTKFKSVADDNFKIFNIMILVFVQVQPAFSPFPTMFFKSPLFQGRSDLGLSGKELSQFFSLSIGKEPLKHLMIPYIVVKS